MTDLPSRYHQDNKMRNARQCCVGNGSALLYYCARGRAMKVQVEKRARWTVAAPSPVESFAGKQIRDDLRNPRRGFAALDSASEIQDTDCQGRLFIFGFGYMALGLAKLLRAKGWTVSGTCRSSGKQRELQAQGFEVFLFDTDHMSLGLGKKGLAALRAATHVLVSISPSSPSDTCPVTWILGREFKHVKDHLRWIGFLSTTSVYGDHAGDWVTEESETRASEGSGLARKEAEVSWLRFGAATGLPVHIFRLAGIYGPGRSAIEAAQRGPSGKRSGKRFTSRCHIHDICQTLIASMASPSSGEIYNVADDDPTNREEVLSFVRSSLLSAAADKSSSDGSEDAKVLSEPQDADEHPRWSGEKRVSNAKIKRELGVKLRFPSFREGLRAIQSGDLTPLV